MAKRLSVILADVDERRIEPFIEPRSTQRAALEAWLAEHGGGPISSEAAVIRALVWAGTVALQDEVLDVAYGELAAYYDERESRAERRAARDRYVARTEPVVT